MAGKRKFSENHEVKLPSIQNIKYLKAKNHNTNLT